jgi:hypothetical protein
VEPAEADQRELERGSPQRYCRTANARVRVDALDFLKSHCCRMRRVKLNEFSFAFEEDTRNSESSRIYW